MRSAFGKTYPDLRAVINEDSLTHLLRSPALQIPWVAFPFEYLNKITGMDTTLNNIDMPVYHCKLSSQFGNLVLIIFIVFLTQNVMTSVQKYQRLMKYNNTKVKQYAQQRCSWTLSCFEIAPSVLIQQSYNNSIFPQHDIYSCEEICVSCSSVFSFISSGKSNWHILN